MPRAPKKQVPPPVEDESELSDAPTVEEAKDVKPTLKKEPVSGPELTKEQKAEALKATRIANLRMAQERRLELLRKPEYKAELQRKKELKVLNALMARHKDSELMKAWSHSVSMDDPATAAAMVAHARHGVKTKPKFSESLPTTEVESSDDDEESSTEVVVKPAPKRHAVKAAAAKMSKLATVSETEVDESSAVSDAPPKRRPMPPKFARYAKRAAAPAAPAQPMMRVV